MLHSIALEGSAYERVFTISNSKLVISGPDYLCEVPLPYKTEPVCMATNMMGDGVVLGYPTERAVVLFVVNKSSGAWDRSVIKRDVDGFGNAVSLRHDRLVVASLDDSTYIYDIEDDKWLHIYTIPQSSQHIVTSPTGKTIILGYGNTVTCYIKNTDKQWTKESSTDTLWIKGLSAYVDDIHSIHVSGNKLVIRRISGNTSYHAIDDIIACE